MIPRVGNQNIILGNGDSLTVKFNNLLIFYKKALPLVGWNTYKTINIKYTNQVIGVKDPDSIKIKTVEVVSKKANLPVDSTENTIQDTTEN